VNEMEGPLRLLVVDDQAVVRLGFTALLDSQHDMSVVGAAGDGQQAVRLATQLKPDVVLMDIRMPVLGGVGPHLWHRRSWIRGTLSRLWQRRRLSVKLSWSLSQSLLLLALVITVTASGLYDWIDTRSRIRWHAISSVILIVVAARHAWTRRQWLLRRRRTGSS